MKAFRALLGLSFKSLLLTTFSMGRGKKAGKAASGVVAFVGLCALMLFISASYSFSLGLGFSMVGALDALLYMMCLFAMVFPFFMVVYAAQGLVFSTKDIDLVLSLPVSSFSVMLSRVLALYLEALMMVELLLIPAGVSYYIFGGVAGPLFIPALILEGVFLALIPTTLALAFGALVSLVVARIRFKNLLNIIFSFVMFALIMVASFGISFSGTMSQTGMLDADALRASLGGAFPPIAWAVRGMLGSPMQLLLLAGVCVAPFFGLTWLFSRFYKKMLTHLASTHVRSDYKLRRVAAAGSFAALLGKEARKFFSTPAYVLNAGIGGLMCLAASVAALVKRSAVQGFVSDLSAQIGIDFSTHVPLVLLGILLFLGSIMYISCVSISLEGKTLWILKEAPVKVKDIFAAKAGFNFIVAGVIMLVCAPMLGWAFALPLAEVLAMLALALLFTLYISVMGLQANLWFPRMDADNETVVIKQSASVFVTMLLGFLALVLMAGLYILMAVLGAGAFLLYAIAAAALLAALNALFIALLGTVGKRQFAEL